MDRDTLKWLWKKTETQHNMIYLLICIDVIISALGVVFALLIRQLINTAVAGHSITSPAAFLFLTVIIQYSLRGLLLYLSESAETKLTNNLRSELIHSLMHADYSETMNHHTGEWMNHLFSDVKIVSSGFVGILPDTAGMAARLIFACGALMMLEPLFFIIYFAAVLILIIVVSLLRKRIKVLHKDVQKKEDQVHSYLQELLENILIIKSFHAYDYMEEKASEYQAEYRDSRMRKRIIYVIANVSFILMFQLGYVSALIWGSYGIYAGTLSYGSLMAILQLILQVRMPVARLSGVLTKVYETIASCDRIRAIAQPVKFDLTVKEPYGFKEIILEDVSFHYDRDLVLDHVDLLIHKGEKTGLTGISGGGKSTLFLLMMGLLKPETGRVSIIDDEGAEIHTEKTRLFAYVPQGNALFSGTIADNIAFGLPYDQARMKKSVIAANADQFIKALPEGILTELKEGGSGLSEGQMQRIAIARAVYSEAPVLLLDEATSALDEQTEAGLLENLSRLHDRTIIIVTHRKAALGICDSVYELDDGKLEKKQNETDAFISEAMKKDITRSR